VSRHGVLEDLCPDDGVGEVAAVGDEDGRSRRGRRGGRRPEAELLGLPIAPEAADVEGHRPGYRTEARLSDFPRGDGLGGKRVRRGSRLRVARRCGALALDGAEGQPGSAIDRRHQRRVAMQHGVLAGDHELAWRRDVNHRVTSRSLPGRDMRVPSTPSVRRRAPCTLRASRAWQSAFTWGPASIVA